MALIMFIVSCIWISWILFFTQISETNRHFLSAKIHLVQLVINLILELPLAMMVSFLGTDIGIVQLGAIEILQYCRLSVLVRDKG